MSFAQRAIDRVRGKRVEKSAPGGYELPRSGGFIPSSWPWNFWQQGRDPLYAEESTTVHACVDAYAQAIPAMGAQHARYLPNGGRIYMHDTPMALLLRTPNTYQTQSDFMMNFIKQLLLFGNAYAVAVTDAYGNATSLHIVPSRSTQVYIEHETKSIFYAVGMNPMLEAPELLVPQRNMLHVKLYTPQNPLVGVSPLANLAASIAANNAIKNSQAAFFHNMSRPSGVLSTELTLTKDQMATLRAAWEMQSASLNMGGIPILAGGLKWQQMSINSQDAQLIPAYNLTVEEIARAYRVPLALVGLGNTTFSNVEQLVGAWLAMGLGFVLEHIENAFNTFFGVPYTDSMEFDTERLLRTDFKGRIDALSKGVLNGIYSPNEARNKEGLASVPYGDEPRLQAQVVPLSQVAMTPSAPSAVTAPVDPAAEADDEKSVDDYVRQIKTRMLA